ncbi:MAG: cytochrome c oxidase subunit II [Armatimonadetes bacterium]|nr:cytochrome c oxidase subunit II [Armatimonadota bacterium]
MAEPSERSGDRRTGMLVGIVIFVLTAAGVITTLLARDRWWLPPVASLHGLDTDRMFYTTLVITGALFVLVHVLLGLFVWRSSVSGEERAYFLQDHRPLELTYTIIPAIGLAVMVTLSGIVWTRIHRPAPADALVVEVRGEQFAWMARYPGPDGAFGRIDPKRIGRDNPMGLDPADQAAADDITVREIHLVVNRPVRVRLRARDVLHSFFVAAFRVKQDAVPGMTVEISFTPTREGDYELACAELCGVGHYIMRGKVKVESQQAFDAWLAQQKPALKSQ